MADVTRLTVGRMSTGTGKVARSVSPGEFAKGHDDLRKMPIRARIADRRVARRGGRTKAEERSADLLIL
jgi:hypothetical protein